MPQPKLTIHNNTGHALDVKGAVAREPNLRAVLVDVRQLGTIA